MTAYEPYPTVEIDGGLFYPDNTISTIRITSGRRDVLDQPNAGFANVELWTDANNPLDIELSDSLKVKINKGTSGTETVFTGTISDIQISLPAYGEVGSIARYNVTAVGALALLNKRTAGVSGYAKEFDGTRIYNILREAFLTEWDDLDNFTSWNELPNTVTWASYDATNEALVNDLAANVDTPGQYELTAYSDGETNALQLAQLAAESGRGVLWEGSDGSLHYDDYAARALHTPLTLTGDDILANGLATNAQWGEIINDVTISYKANATKNAQDLQSQILYGQLAGTKATQLENGADAQEQADSYLESRAYPRLYPEVFTIPLHSPTVSDATRDALAAVYNGLRISTSSLPAVFGVTFDGFVEGWEWNLTRYEATLSLYCSAYSETYLSQIWLQVPQTLTWAGYNPTTTWESLN
jgi:hypothetical protein